MLWKKIHRFIDLILSFVILFFSVLTVSSKLLLIIIPRNITQTMSTAMCVGCIFLAFTIAIYGYRKLDAFLHLGMFRSSN